MKRKTFAIFDRKEEKVAGGFSTEDEAQTYLNKYPPYKVTWAEDDTISTFVHTKFEVDYLFERNSILAAEQIRSEDLLVLSE